MQYAKPTEERFAYEGVGYGYTRWSPCAETLAHEAPATPFVLLHGFAQSASTWEDVAPELARARAVYALDFVGHGRSARPADPAPYAMDAICDALLAFLDHVGQGEGVRPAVVGYSMGGRIALAAAVRDARPFEALVLESAGLGPQAPAEREAAAQLAARRAAQLRAQGVAAFMDEWERLPLFATQQQLPAAARERLRAVRLANDAEALARTFEGTGQHAMPGRDAALEALRKLAEGGAPVLFVAGERDPKYRAVAESLAQNLSDRLSVALVPRAGHNVHLEAPRAFAQVIEQVIEKGASPSK